MYIALFFLISLSSYYGIFYFSYVFESINHWTKPLLLGCINFLYALYWGYFTDIFHHEKSVIVIVSLANTIIAFSAYNVLPHIYYKLKFNYYYLGLAVFFAVCGVFFLLKAMPKSS